MIDARVLCCGINRGLSRLSLTLFCDHSPKIRCEMRNDEYFIRGGAHQPSACAPRPSPTMTSIQANCADGAANKELFTSCVRAWNFLLSVLDAFGAAV
jgi:hypothetical protein